MKRSEMIDLLSSSERTSLPVLPINEQTDVQQREQDWEYAPKAEFADHEQIDTNVWENGQYFMLTCRYANSFPPAGLRKHFIDEEEAKY